jgi:predicted transposase YbfD/YdcC
MVSSFCAENRQVLGQRKTDVKENEITAIPQLLELLDVKGCLVTIDAMGCQRKIAQKIVNKEADYVLAVKANQERLLHAFQRHFPADRIFQSGNKELDTYQTSEKGHGREETRFYFVSETFDEFVDLGLEWPNLQTLGVAVSLRKETGKAAEVAVRYYISSASLTAEQFGKAVRAHWAVESSLHWCLGVGMREDECRIRRGKAAENLAAVRHIAINLLKKETTMKGGIQRKRKHAARKTEYLSKVMEAA